MSKYEHLMTNEDKDIFIPLVPSVLGAMLMSKVSRQKEGFREDLISMVEKDLINLPKENNSELFKSSYVVANGFMEKWGVNYGHSSIKELDTLQMCIERRSRWFTELIETVQPSKFMSYIEYSLRYNPPRTYYTPVELDENPLIKDAYIKFSDYCFKVYDEIFEDFKALFQKRYPDSSKKEIDLKSFENARNVLPLSTHANMGIQSNLRAFCDAISELLSYEGINAEIADTANEMKKEAEKVSVGMVRHAEKTPYLISFIKTFVESSADTAKERNRVEIKVPRLDVSKELIGSPQDMKYFGDLSLMNRFDSLPSVFKTIGRYVDMEMTEACHHQFLRHRGFDYQPVMPTVDFGYILPAELKKGDFPEIEAKISEKIVACYEESCRIFDMLNAASYRALSPYVIINCNVRKVRVFCNFFALSHFITVRRESHAQDEIRQLADRLYEAFKEDGKRFGGLRFDKNEKV